jgi:hypothetical protein
MTDRIRRRRFLSRSLGLLIGPATLSARPAPGASVGAQPSPPPKPEAEADWEAIRREFVMPDEPAYMNNGSLGPMPRSVLAARQRVALTLAHDPTDPDQLEARESLRHSLAAFVGAAPEEVALLRSTTEGMNTFAHGIDWRSGDEVIMCTHEHPGGYGAYKALEARRGIRIRWVDIPSPPKDMEQILDLYRAAIGPRSRLIMASHITFVTGLLMPVRSLAETAHRKGLLISLDGAHPLGMLPPLRRVGSQVVAGRAGHRPVLHPPGAAGRHLASGGLRRGPAAGPSPAWRSKVRAIRPEEPAFSARNGCGSGMASRPRPAEDRGQGEDAFRPAQARAGRDPGR